ncbi:hypothetical protein N7513_004900 [Penicillium frequentans]|nr:hypothetical protein N7513_004900 [Penicillium glabrum]
MATRTCTTPLFLTSNDDDMFLIQFTSAKFYVTLRIIPPRALFFTSTNRVLRTSTVTVSPQSSVSAKVNKTSMTLFLMDMSPILFGVKSAKRSKV